MYIATLQDAQTELAELIERALAGEEIIITRDAQPPVRLIILTNPQGTRRLGGAAGVVKFIAPDFNAPLKDFAEYGVSTV